MVHVAYKGSAPAMTDLLGGHLPMHIDTVNGILEHRKAGRVRILAVTSPQRLRWLPDVPTVAEAGSLPDSQALGWFALFGPARLPSNVVSTISQSVVEELNSDVLKQRIAGHGAEPSNMTQQQFAAFFEREMEKWARIITTANIRVN
jgi:tripartite-type tricarboxylate transporter receptor subunit TctC